MNEASAESSNVRPGFFRLESFRPLQASSEPFRKGAVMSNAKTLLAQLSPRTLELGSRKMLLVGTALGAVTMLALAAGCAKDSSAATSHDSHATEVTEGEPFKITTATVGECKAGAECT